MAKYFEVVCLESDFNKLVDSKFCGHITKRFTDYNKNAKIQVVFNMTSKSELIKELVSVSGLRPTYWQCELRHVKPDWQVQEEKVKDYLRFAEKREEAKKGN